MAGLHRPWATLRGCPGSTSTQCESRAAHLVGNTRSLSLCLSSDRRYTWRAIPSRRSGRSIVGTLHGRDPPAMGRPARVPREHEHAVRESSSTTSHRRRSLERRRSTRSTPRRATVRASWPPASGPAHATAEHGRTTARADGPGARARKSDGRTARRRTASPLSSTRPARAPQSWRSTNTLSHRGHVTTVLPRGSTPFRRVCPFSSPTRVMLRQGNLWRAVTRGIEEECTRSRAGRLHKTRVSSCAWAAGTGLSPYEGRLAAR